MRRTDPCKVYETLGLLQQSGELSPEEQEVWRRHLETCDLCRQKTEHDGELDALWSAEPQPDLDPEAFAVMIQKAAAQQQSSAKPKAGKSRLIWWAAAASLLVLITGRMFFLPHSPELPDPAQSSESVLINDPSAINRLTALMDLGALEEVPTKVYLDALIRESSPNVSLAVVDSLYGLALQSQERKILAETLGQVRHPTVKTALIDLLVNLQVREARTGLQRLSRESRDPLIKARARWGVAQLN